MIQLLFINIYRQLKNKQDKLNQKATNQISSQPKKKRQFMQPGIQSLD